MPNALGSAPGPLKSAARLAHDAYIFSQYYFVGKFETGHIRAIWLDPGASAALTCDQIMVIPLRAPIPSRSGPFRFIA